MTTWADAMASALYGPQGFYRLNSPEQHFRTSANASPLLAEALAVLVTSVDEALRHPSRFDLIDVGAGDGRLLADMCALLPDDLADRLAPVCVEVRPRPSNLPSTMSWTNDLPTGLTGLVIAHEFLDNVPCDVVEVGESERWTLIDVDLATGEETTAQSAGDQALAWLDEWWPIGKVGDRAEIGTERDAAWSNLVNSLDRGVAVAIDYGHILAERVQGAYAPGTLTAYRGGHQIIPVPDGSCDITAHVAIDACAAAGRRAGAESTVLKRQATALSALGLKATRPSLELARSDPPAYVRGLSRASQAAELLDPSSLGSFWWLLHSKGCTPVVDGLEWD